MASRGDMIKRGRARVDARRAARNREESMARQGATRFKRENIDTDQRIGLRASIDETPILSEGVRTVENIGKKYLPSIYGGVQRGLDSLTGAWNEAQEARRDDKKWTLGGDPLDVTRGSDAYRYLLTQIDDPEDRKAFRREVGKDNLHWTELNEYAGENAAGLAKKINEYNKGIRSFPRGEDAYEDLIGQGKALRDTGMLGDAAADQAEWLTRTGQPFDRRQMSPAYNPGKEDDIRITYGEEELPTYSDAPYTITEDYGETDVGLMGPGPGPLVGYTDRDLERDEVIDERLSEVMYPYTNYNPFGTPYTPIESPPEEEESFYDKYIDPWWNTGYDYYSK